MEMLYLDGSGNPELDGRPLYVFLGLAIPEGAWGEVEERIRVLKSHYRFSEGLDFELHAKDFCCTIREQAEIDCFDRLDWRQRRSAVLALRASKLTKYTGKKRRAKQKQHRATDPFVHLSRAQRSKLYEEALDLLGQLRNVRLFAEVVDKQYLLQKTGELQAVRQGFEQVVTRFDAYLTKMNQGLNKNWQKNHGILVMDNEPTHETRYRTMLTHFREHGHSWGQLDWVIEAPFFTPTLNQVDPAVASCDLLSGGARCRSPMTRISADAW